VGRVAHMHLPSWANKSYAMHLGKSKLAQKGKGLGDSVQLWGGGVLPLIGRAGDKDDHLDVEMGGGATFGF